mgnify:CR=1 FL=1
MGTEVDEADVPVEQVVHARHGVEHAIGVDDKLVGGDAAGLDLGGEVLDVGLDVEEVPQARLEGAVLLEQRALRLRHRVVASPEAPSPMERDLCKDEESG